MMIARAMMTATIRAIIPVDIPDTADPAALLTQPFGKSTPGVAQGVPGGGAKSSRITDTVYSAG